MLNRRTFLAAPAALTACGTPTRGDDASEGRRAQALFAAYWDETAELYPEWATFRGDNRYGDRWTDASVAGRARQQAYWRALVTRAEAIRRDRMSPADQLSLDLLLYDAREQVAFQRFPGFEALTLDAIGDGFQSELANLLRTSPVETVPQVEQMLARLARYGERVDQEIVHLREGMALGWVSARPVLDRVLAQLDSQLAARPADGPFGEPLKRLSSSILAADQAALRQRFLSRIDTDVLPPMRRLRAFIADEYRPRAPANGALSGYPGGDAVYAASVRRHTTTELTPQQIHTLGLERTEALFAQLLVLKQEAGFGGSFPEFIRFLNQDPAFFYPSPEALLAGYRDIAKRIDPALARLFAKLPRTPYGVRAMPDHIGSEAADGYEGPSADGSRPGWFNANVAAWRTRPRWAMETLVAHEAAPGHHLQTALALEQQDLPEFRRQTFHTAYVEGWALYAETLGPELGLYQDPTARFGHLRDQALRAARLVVDTGLHAFGWSRQRAIDYMIDKTGLEPGFVGSEVDRYAAWPGQALAYMIGQTKIIELRERARKTLGARFDIRHFHATVLESGSVPLPVLETMVQAWIDTVAAQP